MMNAQMNPRLRSLAAVASGLILTGVLAAAPIALEAQPSPLAVPASAPQHCFYASNVNNFTTEGDKTVYIRVGVGDVYRLDLMTSCPEMSGRQSIGLERTVSGSNTCSALDLTVVFRLTGGERRSCPVQEMHQLTNDEIAALPKRDLP